MFLFRVSAPIGPIYSSPEPSFCVIAQGSKELFLGGERYRYDASNYLLISAKLPLEGHIIEASRDRPYLALRLVLQPGVITDVLTDVGRGVPPEDVAVKAIAVSRLDAHLLDAVVRLVRLIDAPNDFRILAPLAIREIVYRLLSGEQGDRLRQIAVVGGHANQIAKAIEYLRAQYDRPLSVAALARQVAMSVSAFHHHFKAVTGTTPLQFQKYLRLHQARRLLLPGDVDVASVGFRVGYDDASHFSREYKRLFGKPPARDVEGLRSPSESAQRSRA